MNSLLSITVSVVLTTAAAAQTPVALRFSEVSLRESDPSGRSRPGATFLPSGEFTASLQTVRQLVARAYGVREYQVVDGPDWITEARFDISARAPEAASALDGPGMLRGLLAERFGLAVRDERRKIPAYVLERSGRRLGRRLQVASARCTPLPGQPEATRQSASGVNECTAAAGWSSDSIFIRQSPIQTLARFLESEIGQPIVDRTGLKGKYDADVYSPGVGPGGERPARREPDDVLFTAVRDQLGLKLEPGNVEFRVVTIESARRPMPD